MIDFIFSLVRLGDQHLSYQFISHSFLFWIPVRFLKDSKAINLIIIWLFGSIKYYFTPTNNVFFLFLIFASKLSRPLYSQTRWKGDLFQEDLFYFPNYLTVGDSGYLGIKGAIDQWRGSDYNFNLGRIGRWGAPA